MYKFILLVCIYSAYSCSAFSANPDGDLRLEVISAYNFVVDSNNPESGPSSAYVGVRICNDGTDDLTNVIVNIGDFAMTTPGTYPSITISNSRYSGTFSLEHSGICDEADATRSIGLLAAGECIIQYWLLEYPVVDGSGNSTVGGNSLDDDLALDFDFWATATDPIAGALAANDSWTITLRSMISAMANKSAPNGTNKVPDEYLDAIEDQLGWRPDGNTSSAGSTFQLEGIWYDLGNINKGYDNDGDFVPDYNIFMQPVGDPSQFDACCYRLSKTYGLLVVKLNDGTEHLIPFEDQSYFSNIPDNNRGAVGIVYYEFLPISAPCNSNLSPYQCVASGRDNEKYNGDYGTSAVVPASEAPSVTFTKTGPATSGDTPPLTYTLSLTNDSADPAGIPLASKPLVISDAIPDGTAYITGSAALSGTPNATIYYSTDNGANYSTTEPGSGVTNIQWWLDDVLVSSATVTAIFNVTMDSPSTPIVENIGYVGFGSDDPFTSAETIMIVEGTNSIGDLVYEDDGGTTGTAGNGSQDGDESGIQNISVYLYYDTDGNGQVGSTDIALDTAVTDANGAYLFSNLTDGNFIVVVDNTDVDLPAGWGISSGNTTTAVTLSGGDNLEVDYGFSPALSLTKTITSSEPAYEDQDISYNLEVTNLIGAVAESASASTEIINAWAEAGTNSGFTSSSNAYDNTDGGNTTFANAGSNNSIAFSDFSYLTGITAPSSTITKVEAALTFYLTGTVPTNNSDVIIVTPTKGGTPGTSTTISGATLQTYDAGATSSGSTVTLYVDITASSAGLTNWTDLTAVDRGLTILYDRVGSNDGVTLYLDAVGFRVTHSTSGDGGYTQTTCGDSPIMIASPTSLTLGDDEVTSAISLSGFNFKYFGNTVSQTYISSNGFVTFTAPASDGVSAPALTTIPDANFEQMIAFCSADLDPSGGGTVQYGYSADGAVFIVDFTNIQHYNGGSGGEPITSQLQLHSGTNEVRIVTTSQPSTAAHLMGLQYDVNNYFEVSGRNGTSWTATNECLSFANQISSDFSATTSLLPVPLKDTFDPTQMCFVEASITPDSINNTTGEVFWDNIGPINGGETQTVSVTFEGKQPSVAGEDLINNASVTGATFANGIAANDDTAADTTTLQPTALYSGTIYNTTPSPDVEIAGVTVYLCSGTTIPCNATNATDSTSSNGIGYYEFDGLINGSYTVGVKTDDLPDPTLTQDLDPGGAGSLDSHDPFTIASAVDDIGNNFGYQVSNAVSGSVWEDVNGDGTSNNGDDGLAGITVSLHDCGINGTCGDGDDGTTVTTTTDANGNYSFEDLTDGNYSVEVDNTTLPVGGTWSNTVDPEGTPGDDNSNVIAVSGGNIYADYNFGYNESGASTIGDVLYVDWNSNGSQDSGIDEGLSGVIINLYYDADNDGVIDAATDALVAIDTTEANGAYSFANIPAGNYIVEVVESTLPSGVSSQTADPDESGKCTICNATAVVSSVDGTSSYLDEDFGYAPFGTGQIGNTVFVDDDGDGINDSTESGIANVDVILYTDLDGDGNFTSVDTVTTNADGNYLFENLPDGNYQVLIDPAETSIPQDSYGNDAITTSPSTQDVVISGGDVTSINSSSCTSCDLNVDFGYAYSASIGDIVFYDNNGNGTQDLSESGIAGVTIYLCPTSESNCNSSTASFTDVTDANGNYLFTGLDPGDYNVVVDAATLPSGVSASVDPDSDGLACSDADLISLGYSACDNTASSVTVNYSTQMLGIDFGYEPSTVIGDQVWFDVNGDGSYDDGEPAIAYANIILTPPAGVDLGNGNGVADTVTTDADGQWSYANLSDGTYTATLDMATVSGYTAGYDADGGTDNSTSFTISSGSVSAGANGWCSADGGCDSDLDFAVELAGSSSISGSVCLDDGSGDGVCSTGGESMLDGTIVYLYNDGGTFLGSSTVDTDGNYSFSGLPDDNYNVVIATTTNPLDLTSLTTTASDTPASAITTGTTSVYQTITVSGSDITALDFAFQVNIDIDFGDLPGPYPTALTDGPSGAYHLLPGTIDLVLGSLVDAETSPIRNLTASGDDAEGSNDHDGITFNSTATWTTGTDGASIDIVVGGSLSNGYVIGWIDFNEDGDFTDSGEMILDSLLNTGTHSGYTFDVPVGTDLTAGNILYARFRVFESAPAFSQFAYSGEADNGEVEDYRVVIDVITNTTLPIDDDNATIVNLSVDGSVLTNDLDLQGDDITFGGFDNPADPGNYATSGTISTIPGTDNNGYPVNDAGDLTVNADGSYTFTPTTNFIGTISIEYKLCDDGTPQACELATLTINVNPVPDELDVSKNSIIANNDDNVTYDNVNVDGDVVSNDGDPDGDNITFSGFEDPSNAGTYDQNTGMLVDIDGIDSDGLPVSNAGDLIINSDGSYTFDPEAGFTGTINIDYQICDDATSSNCDVATLTIIVSNDAGGVDNDPPFAGDDYGVTPENTVVTGNWLKNDNDTNSDNLTVNGSGSNVDPSSPGDGSTTLASLTTDEGGSLVIYDDGSFLYTPPTNYSGTDQVSYLVCDVTATAPTPLCDSATIYLSVTPINETFAVNDENVTLQDSVVNGDVITNDFDPFDQDGQSFSTFLDPDTGLPPAGSTDPITITGKGVLTPDGSGGYSFDPDPSYTGTVEIDYQVCDDGAPVRCDTAKLVIDVIPVSDPTNSASNDIIANDDDNVTYVNKAVSGDLLANDSDPEGDNITFSGFDDGSLPTDYKNSETLTTVAGTDEDGNAVADAGDLVINADGTYTFTPTTDFVGRVVMPYQICDDESPQACETANLTIDVLPDADGSDNDPPFAGDDFSSTAFNAPLSGTFVDNDNDINGDNITFAGTTIDTNDPSPTDIGTYTTEQGGSIIFYTDGSYNYTPPSDHIGPDSYAYQVCDDGSPVRCDSATVNLVVFPIYRDYSDLDSGTYATASHQGAVDANGDNVPDLTNAIWLGTNVDYESSDKTSATADGDDNDGINDDDGVTFPSTISAGSNSTFTIEINSNTSKTVHFGVWVDWDQNGTFETFQASSGTASGGTDVDVSIPVPGGYGGGEVFVRVRAFDSAPSAGDYAGDFANGEVEDYRIAGFTLPVELADFFAENKDCAIELQWATFSEERLSHYELEHSTDRSSFSKIADIESQNIIDYYKYNFTHTESFKENYYRLKIVEDDGTYSYSKVIFIEDNCEKELHMNVYPNPISSALGNKLDVMFSEPLNLDGQLIIYDALGNVIQITNIKSSDLSKVFVLDVNDLSAGTYFIAFQSKNGQKRLNQTFVKNRL